MKASITMLSCQHFLSGIGQYGYGLAKEMRKQEADLWLYKPYKAAAADAHYHALDWVKPISYRSIGQLHPYILPLFLANGVRSSHKKDVFHAHWFLSGLALSYIKKRFVVTMHDASLLHVKEQAPRYTQYYRWALERFKKLEIPLIVVSETAKQDLLAHADYPEKLVHAIHNGIDFGRFFPKPSLLAEPKPFTIAYAGGLGPRKNLGLLLEAFAVLEKQYPHIRLLIAGAFPEKTPYPTLAKSLKLKNATFVGFLPDERMGNFYREADLFIFPSEYEGFGFSPLEAMACGTPVLCAKGGALTETSGEGAFFFDYHADDLVAKASAMISSAALREQWREKGLAWVSRYTWEHCAQQTFGVYEQ